MADKKRAKYQHLTLKQREIACDISDWPTRRGVEICGKYMLREYFGKHLALDRPRKLAIGPELLLVAAIFCLAALLRFATLDRNSLWVDEGYTWAITKLSFRHLLTIPFDIHPPGFYAAIKLAIGGDTASEQQLRFVSALSSTLSLVPLYVLARYLMGNCGAIVSIAIYATSFTDLVYATDARSYSLLGLFLITLFLALYRVFHALAEANRISGWEACAWAALYVGSAITAVYIHNLAVFYILLANALWMLRAVITRRSQWARFVVLQIIMNVAVVLAWLPWAFSIASSREEFSWLQQATIYDAAITLAVVVLPNWTGLLGAIAASIGFVTSIAVLSRLQDDLFYVVTFHVIVFPFAVWGIGYISQPIFMERSILTAQVGSALAIGAVAAYLRILPAASGIVAIAIVSHLVSAALFLTRTGKEPSLGGHLVQDWRNAIGSMDDRSAEHHAIILCDIFTYPTVRYYSKNSDILLVEPDGRLLRLTDEDWLTFYGQPVKTRTHNFAAVMQGLEHRDSDKRLTWAKVRNKYESVTTIRPAIFCSSRFEEEVSNQLAIGRFGMGREKSQTGVVALEFERAN